MSIRSAWPVALVGLGVGLAVARAGARPASSSQSPSEAGKLAVVIHVNFPETGRQGHGLKNVSNILKQVPDASVEVVCHGAGIGLVEKARTEHAEQVKTLLGQGVRFVACENTMRQKSIRKDDLLPEVGTVPSGAVEVIRKQQGGYAYFRP